MINLEDPARLVETPEPELYKAIYRRRGSDLIFAVTETSKVQVHRINHRFKTDKAYSHPNTEIEVDKEEIKAMLEKEGYKLISDGMVDAEGNIESNV